MQCKIKFYKIIAFLYLSILLTGGAVAGDVSFKILVFNKTQGFTHQSIPTAVGAIQSLGSANNFTVDVTDDASAFSVANLKQYQAVVFLMTTGNVLNASQQSAFEQYIQNGGGYVGVHSASDTEYDWPWYGGLVGAYFSNHPAQQEAIVEVENQTHPSSQGLPLSWERFDEWYNFQTNPRDNSNIKVLATLDESTYNGGNMGDDHPIIWYQAYDGGRSWYTAMGHTNGSYSEPDFLSHLLGGIRYSAGVAPADPLVVDESGQWFKKQNSNTPFFMAGVGGPEGYLFETDARKQEIVDDLIASGANALYMHTIRSFEGDGYDYEDPFNINNDPSSGVRDGVFANWRSFLTQLDANGIVTWIHVIDDTARPWGCDVPLNQDAKDYIEELVTTFRDLDHLVWLSGEEYLMGSCNAAEDKALMEAIAAEIRIHDPIHPVGVHHNNSQNMQFGDSENVNVFAQQICGPESDRSPEGVHNKAQQGDWVYVMAECHPWHLNLLHSNDRNLIRQSNWGTVLGGGYTLLYNAYECAHGGRLCSRDSNGDPASANDPHDPSADILGDLNRIREFMEASRFNELIPDDALVAGDALWASGNVDAGIYVVYAKDSPSTMGVSALGDTQVRLNWFNPLNGARVTEEVDASLNPFQVPASFGAEAALFIERLGEPQNRAPMAFADNYSVEANGSLAIAAPGVLGNDFDADGDSLTAILVSDVGNGNLNLADDGGFSYQPDNGFEGQDSFSYKANDGELDSSTVSVNIQVGDTSGDMQAFLINAEADVQARLMGNKDQIVLSTLGFSEFSIEAVQVPVGTLSVRMTLTGPVANSQVENVAPYALFGDSNGDFDGVAAVAGDYRLIIEAFDGASASGTELAELDIMFSFVNSGNDIIFSNGFEQ